MGTTRQQLRRLRRHVVPSWWRDAKLGIFVHWTPASVPAFAPTDVEIGDLLASGDPDALSRVPYTEWYENSLRFADSPVARHHATTYGDRPYAAFAADWEAGLEQWDPDDWAARLRRDRCQPRRVRRQAQRRLLPVAHRRHEPAPRALAQHA